MNRRRFTVTLEQDPEEGWWIGLVKELPGCGSRGRALQTCREMVADAIREYLVPRGGAPRLAGEGLGDEAKPADPAHQPAIPTPNANRG